MNNENRDSLLRCARVYLREAYVRRGNPVQRGFCFALIEWAGNCRRKAMSIEHVGQIELF